MNIFLGLFIHINITHYNTINNDSMISNELKVIMKNLSYQIMYNLKVYLNLNLILHATIAHTCACTQRIISILSKHKNKTMN